MINVIKDLVRKVERYVKRWRFSAEEWKLLKIEKIKCYKYKNMVLEMKNSSDRLISRVDTAKGELVNLNMC